jgi:DNA (cytosine-5)-methyltransferase 1
MKYIDLFAGIGGFHYGIEKAFDIEYAPVSKKPEQEERTQGGKRTTSEQQVQLRSRNRATPLCVYSNEWDKYANSVYRKHYGECDQTDIRKVATESIPDHDLLCGGFPCQSFSIAGKRAGFNDTRGTLFFDIARILKEKQPRLCLLENVKGLLSHDEGRTIKTIFATLTELGYDLQWQVLNSKDFGVPQNRERIFIIGHLRGTPRPEVFPIGESGSGDIESKQDDSRTARTVSARFRKGVGNTESRIVDVLVDAGQGQRIRSIEGLAQTLSGLGGGQGAKTGLYTVPVLTPDRLKKRQNGRRFKTNGEPSFTLTGQDIHGVFNGSQIRRLTPVECERLQGFPDNWTQYGSDGELISDTQRYKMCGNAVTTNVVTEIIKRLVFAL